MKKSNTKGFKTLSSDEIKQFEDYVEHLGFCRRVCLAILTKTYDELCALADDDFFQILQDSCNAWADNLKTQSNVLDQTQERLTLIKHHE